MKAGYLRAIRWTFTVILVATVCATAQITYQPKFPGDPAHSDSEAAALGYMRTLLRDKDVRHSGISREGQTLIIKFRDAATRDKARGIITESQTDLDLSDRQDGSDFVLAGTLNSFSSLTLYRSFEIGKLAVVAPLSASYPALTLIFSWLGGEHLAAIRITGIVSTLLGAVLVAAAEKKAEQIDIHGAVKTDPRHGKGIGWALCAVFGFGVLFWLLGKQVVPRLGAAPAVWMIRLTSVILTTAILLLARQPIKLPRGPERKAVWGMGLLDTSAFVMSNRGMQLEQIAVVSVLGSLYGVVTFLLAAIFLRESISRWQIVGIITIFVGIVLIGR